MSELSERRIKEALYIAVMNKLAGELSELEAREIMLVNGPTYITSKDHDHAEHVEELKFDAIEWGMMVQEGKKLWSQHEKELLKNPERFDG